MKKGIVLFAGTVLAGLAAGVLRAFELAFVFDNETQLMESAHPYTILLLCLAAVFIAFVIFLAVKSPQHEPGETNRPPSLWLFIEVVACALLLFSCAYGLVQLRENFHAVMLIFQILGILTAFSMLVAAFYTRKGVITASTGFYYTVPVFWCCFAMVLDFWSHSANPVILSFVYMMFALIFTSLSAHTVAGFCFGRMHKRRGLAYCALGMFFSIMTLVSLVIYPVIETQGQEFIKVAVTTPGALANLGFMVLHLGALFYATFSGAFRVPAAAAGASAQLSEEYSGDMRKALSGEDDVSLEESGAFAGEDEAAAGSEDE